MVVWSVFHIASDSGDSRVFAIYGQRIGTNGELLWGQDGVLIGEDNEQRIVSAVPDGMGGMVVGWYGAQAQHISADGELLHGAEDFEVPPSPTARIPDGYGGRIAPELREYRYPAGGGGYLPHAISISRFNSEGNLLWIASMDIPGDKEGVASSRVSANQSGGALVVYGIGLGGSSVGSLYFQRIDSKGDWQVAGQGALVFPGLAAKYQYQPSQWQPSVVADGQGGGIVVAVAGKKSFRGDTIFAQRMDGHGNPLWGKDGLRVYP